MIATEVKVKLVNEEFMGEFYFNRNQEALAQQLLKEGRYRDAGEFAVMGQGEDAAEEVFDLTNNPGRDAERAQLYGRKRSVSVGDIVEVNGDNWLCCSSGWWKMA